mmetsp:Transcript_50791/g.99557  ORF Transcript_50791/g.99557 Transcript_50791/m.99557 type:complete len:546 (-) Transcript_50791:14-1651(-)
MTCLVFLLLFIGAVANNGAKRPHILVIVADDLGWNDVDFHGSEQIPTPNLSNLAKKGVIFDNYYVQPVCSPTRSTLLTGRHVIHTGIYDPDCGPGNTYSVPYNFTMLPEHLNTLGYESHAVGKWHLGMFSDRVVPTGKGFKTFLGYYGGAEDYYTHQVQGANDFHDDVGSQLRADTSHTGEYSTFIYARRASEIIANFSAQTEASQDGQRSSLFMYLAFQAIHSPDQVPDSYRDRFTETIPDTPDGVGQHRRTVAGMVACLDEAIGNVTEALRKNGMLDDTLIVFTTDNGGPAQGFNDNMASNWPLRGMKRTLWQGGVRGVSFVTGAGLKKTGYISQGLMHVADWFPSLLTAASQGLPGSTSGQKDQEMDWRKVVNLQGEPPWQAGDGEDLWKMISEGAPSPRSEVLLEAHHGDGSQFDDGNGQAIIVGDLKLILEKGPEWHGPPNDLWYESGSNPSRYNHTVQCTQPPPKNDALPLCLFNLTADPCEYYDLSAQFPHEVARLKNRLAAYQKTAVPKDFHKLPLCKQPSSPVDQPVNGTWMPVCP